MSRVSASLLAFLLTSTAHAEEAAVPEITVTAPYRGIPTTIAKAGSAVTVVTAEEIARRGAKTVRDVLETVPGVAFNSYGGEGTTTAIYLRGASTGQGLVLIDGVRVGDPTDIEGSFNFGAFPLDSVERIEVLRGPQSALYGSDAMGGVINIVTKRPKGPLQVQASTEVGSYRTHRETLAVSGAKDGFSLSAGGGLFRTSGFSRASAGTEDDATARFNGYGKLGWQATDDLAFELAIDGSRTDAEYDGWMGDSLVNESRTDLLSGRFTTTAQAFDDRWTSVVTLFANQNERRYDEDFSAATYEGVRTGIEYQGTVDTKGWGTAVFGAGFEHEAVDTVYDDFFDTYDSTLSAGLDHSWAFLLHQFSPTEALALSAAVRFDDYEQSGSFATWRLTGAYQIFATETVLRASLGTGAKAPSAYQLFGVPYDNPDLQAEESIGGDVGIDQTLFDGRATVSATAFYNRYENLISYVDPDGWMGPDPGSYVNTARAETGGLELAGSVKLVPNALSLDASYTYLLARDLDTDTELARRPKHSGSVGLTWTGLEGLTLGARVVLVGERFNAPGEIGELPAYARVDLDASYAINDKVSLTGRVVNLLDAEYEEIDGYNTSGFAAYGGLKIRY